jgi:pimeloyl-ACP methyl ester carboxylesterase
VPLVLPHGWPGSFIEFLDIVEELVAPPRELAAAQHNIVRWNVADSGGHFAALERPKALIDDLRQFATPVR